LPAKRPRKAAIPAAGQAVGLSDELQVLVHGEVGEDAAAGGNEADVSMRGPPHQAVVGADDADQRPEQG
jgi:hypothetical protein